MDPPQCVGGVHHHLSALQGRVLDASCWSIMPCCSKSKRKVSGVVPILDSSSTLLFGKPPCPLQKNAVQCRSMQGTVGSSPDARNGPVRFGAVLRGWAESSTLKGRQIRPPVVPLVSLNVTPPRRRCRGGRVCIGGLTSFTRLASAAVHSTLSSHIILTRMDMSSAGASWLLM